MLCLMSYICAKYIAFVIFILSRLIRHEFIYCHCMKIRCKFYVINMLHVAGEFGNIND